MERRDRLAVAGWAASLVAVPVAVDSIAFRTDRESMSGLAGRAVWHPITGPAVIAVGAGLIWHLVQAALDRR